MISFKKKKQKIVRKKNCNEKLFKEEKTKKFKIENNFKQKLNKSY